jgi:hypothetical protein
MKKFSKMTQSEIYELTDEEFNAISPFEKKSCYDCKHLKHTMNFWCTNEDAKKARGTSIPGCIKCRFWEPNFNMIDPKYKTEENGYIKPELKWHQKLFKFLFT